MISKGLNIFTQSHRHRLHRQLDEQADEEECPSHTVGKHSCEVIHFSQMHNWTHFGIYREKDRKGYTLKTGNWLCLGVKLRKVGVGGRVLVVYHVIYSEQVSFL